MGTRGWTFSTFLGCCTWILHGLGAVAAVPVTADGPFTAGTAFPITTENEWPRTTLTEGISPTATDAETSPVWTETNPVTAMSEYGSTVPALGNVTKPANTTQSTERSSAAATTDTTAAGLTAQYPAVTPEAERGETEVPPDVPLGTTPVLEDVKEDIPANRGEDTDLSTGTAPPLAVTWVPQPTAGVTVLPSQGLTTAKGAVEEGVILPEAIQSEASANSLGPRPDAGELLPTQQDEAVGVVDSINPEPAGEVAPAGEESPLASESGDAINGEFSTAGPSLLPPESPVMSGTVENPGESSLLPGQAVLSPDTSLTPSNGGDGDEQGVPGVSSEASGSALSPAASRAPVAPEETEGIATSLLPSVAPEETEGIATSLLPSVAPEQTEGIATSLLPSVVPSYAQSHTTLPVSATSLPPGDVAAVYLASPSLQPAPWQTPTGEQPPLLPDALTSPTDTPSAPGAAYPAAEAGASTLPEADGAEETPANPDLSTAPEASMSPSLVESQPEEMPAGAPQEANGLGTGWSSDSDAPSPAPFVPDGLAWPTAGIQGQGAEGVKNIAQAGGSEDASPYEDTQSDMTPPALRSSASPTDYEELLTGGTEDLANAEVSPPSTLGDGTEAVGAPALGQVSSPGPAPPNSVGMEPDLSQPEGPGDLPSESASAPGAVFPPPGSVAGPVSEAERPVSPNLGAAQGAPGSPSLAGSQPWGTAADALPGAGLPGAQGPDTDSASAWHTPSSVVHGPVGPPSPGLGDHLGTSVGLPAAEGQEASTAEQALEGAGSGIESEPSLGSTTGNGIAAGMEQLPGAGSSPGIVSPSDVVAGPSVSRGDEAGAISSAAPGPDSLSPASLDSETGPGLGLVQGAESGGDVAQAGNAESESPNMETSASAVSPQQDLTNIGELPAGESGDMAHAELSPPSALGDGTGTGGTPPLGQESSPGPAPPNNAGMEPDLSRPEGPGDLPSESASAPGAVFPPPGSVAGPVSEAERPVSPNLGAAQGAPGSPSLAGSQPLGTAAGALPGAGLPGAQGPDTDSASAWDTSSSAVHGPVGPPSPGLGDHLGTSVGLPAAEGQGASMAEQALEGAGSGIESEPSLGSTTGNGIAAGMEQLPGAGSPPGIVSPSDVVAGPSVSRGDEAGAISSAAPGPDSLSPASLDSETGPGLGLVQGAESAGDVAQAGNPESESPNMETSASAVSPQQDQLPAAASSSGSASPSGEVAASSVSDSSSLGAVKGAGSAAEALQPSLGAGTGVLPAAGEGANEVAGDGESTGQSQAPTRMGPAGSGTPGGETGDVLQSASSSSSTQGSSLPGRAGEAADETSLAGAAGAGSGLNTGLEAAGPQEPSVSAPGTQSGATAGLSDGKLGEVDVVEVPGGASMNGGPSPGASLVPAAPDNSGVSDGTTTSVAASPLLPGRGLSSGLAPNGNPNFAASTQSGSSPLLPGPPGGLAEEAGSAQSWSLEDEVASGMPAPSGEVSPHAAISPNAAPVLPPAPQTGIAAEGVSASPGLSARESIAGSSAGGKEELGVAMPGGPALLLPPQPGSPRAPSGNADSPVPGEASAVLHGTMAGEGDVTHLLPSATDSGAHMEALAHSPPGGSPGLPGLPPAGITAGSSGAKTPGPGPAGGSSPAALQPFLGRELTTSLANRAPATSGSSLPGVFPDQGGTQGRSPATARPATSCSPALAGPAPPAPLPRGREVLPRPGTATVTSRASSPVVPAPPGGPAAAPTPLPSPTVPAVPLYAYGARENDQEYVERRVDFNSPLFKPEIGFPFGRTLHTSLYFTDNGQIIFPATDNRVLTYPNPPPGGFNGHEEVPMIAVFWDNADFSRGVGTTFYQEFSTLNTAKPPFVRDVEAKVRRYLRSSYSAAWTLKITWEKAPASAAWTDTRKTVTYQAVLTTDGFRSYILMLYQDGGMQWDYTRLTSTNVLIGYTSGDGYYHNDDLTKRPPAAKYRPDQFRGYNTDLRGLWIYKLESRVGINYRLKCLAWTGQQQEPRAWSQGLPTCPCSLQQGQQDPRFKNSRGGRWGARVSMLHSASPNQHGAGVRCLYDSQNQLIEGRQERYWRSFRQASPYRDQELKLYDWCCNRAGSAHLCAHYSEKRPKIGCDGYQSPGTDSLEEAENYSDEQIDGEDK